MTIEQRILTVLEEWGSRERKAQSLLHLEEFYVRMKEKGLIRKNEYTIPPLDTVGRGAYAEAQLRNAEETRTRG